jgi:GNAT superfamily N-acetyltransferase
MHQGITPVRGARPDELDTLQDIEVAAGRLFTQVGMSYISDHLPPAIDLLQGYQRGGRAWVSTDPTDHPIAYLIADLVDANAHIEQVSVHPSFSRRGIGRSLIDHLGAWAREHDRPAVTLTTFAEVPWNGPYYVRCGFRAIPDAEMGPELAVLFAGERARGLARDPRVAMVKAV